MDAWVLRGSHGGTRPSAAPQHSRKVALRQRTLRSLRIVPELADLLATLSPHDHVRGRQFERVCKWVLTESPYYRPFVARAWLWDDWPGRWSSDAGIDLVAETHDGALWAIQAKAYDPAYAIRKADIDTFLSESARPSFSYRLLMASTDRIGARAASTLEGQAIPVGLALRADLAAQPVDWPDHVDRLAPGLPIRRKEPRPASLAAVADVVSGFEGATRGQLLMACGTGKTLVGMWVAEGLGASSTLVLVPSLSLLAQTLREWSANWTVPRSVIAVCSDDTVAEDAALSKSRDLGIPVTTDAAAVSRFLAGRGMQLVLATYQSSSVLVEAAAAAGHRFDLCIADEAHRCAGPSTGPFGQVLDDSRLPAARRLFMTATPRLFSSRLRVEAAAGGIEVASMSDEQRFGPVLHQLTFGRAVREGLLTDYKVVITAISDPDLHAAVQERSLVQGLTPAGLPLIDTGSLAAVATVAKALEKYELTRAVTFHSRVKNARDFANRLAPVSAWLSLKISPEAQHVNGDMTAGERLRALRILEQGSASRPVVVTNARCLTEGVDIPSLDAVAFVDPRSSQIDIVQAVGRVMRKAEHKVSGTIVLPLYLTMEQLEAGEDLDPKDFATVWQVVRALRAHDETLAEELDEIRRSLGRQGKKEARLPSRLVLDLPASINPEVFDSLVLRIIESTTEAWDHRFGVLQAYVREQGHASPLSTYVLPDKTPLGAWVARQRTMRRQGMLRADRAAALEELPGWTWDALDERWLQGHQALTKWVSANGVAVVPAYAVSGEYGLGRWVGTQRRAYKRGQLTPEAIAALEALPGWSWNVRADTTEAMVAALRRFEQREGHTLVPNNHYEDGQRLGYWVGRCRRQHARGTLGAINQAALEAIPNWRWTTPNQRVKSGPQLVTPAWLAMYRLVESFCAREGHALVPHTHTEGGRDLGGWVGNARNAFRRGGLHAEAVALLERLPGWTWDPKGEQWQRGLETLVVFSRAHGHLNPSSRDFPVLAEWVKRQRSQYRTGRLSAERTALLEALPGWDWGRDNGMPKRSVGTGRGGGSAP